MGRPSSDNSLVVVPRVIIFCTIALLAINPGARAEDLAYHLIFEQQDALFGRTGASGPAEKLCDKAHYEKAERDGSRYYVLLRYDDHRTWLTVLQCDSAGVLRSVRTIADKKLQPVTAIMSASFLSDGRLLVDTHVSPRVSISVTLDMTTGQQSILESDD